MQSTPQKRRWPKIVGRLALVAAVYLALCVYLANSYIHPARAKVVTPDWVTEVTIPEPNGSNPAWASPRLAAGKGEPVVFVLAYGYGGTRESWADVMNRLPKAGFECVTPCMPGQEASHDPSIGFGVKEADTIVATVKWVRSQYKKPPKIVLWGVSMGGAASWIASEKDPSVDAVITDGAYAVFEDAMNNWLNRKLPGSSFYLKPMIWIASAMDHIDPATIIPANSAEKWHKPALVVQGADDTLIPMSHADRLAKAANCPLWVVPGAQHAKCFQTDPKTYLQKLKELVKKL